MINKLTRKIIVYAGIRKQNEKLGPETAESMLIH